MLQKTKKREFKMREGDGAGDVFQALPARILVSVPRLDLLVIAPQVEIERVS